MLQQPSLDQGQTDNNPPARLMVSTHRVNRAPLSNTQTQHTPYFRPCVRAFEWVILMAGQLWIEIDALAEDN